MPQNIPVRDGNDEVLDGPYPYVTIEFVSGSCLQVRPTVAYELEQWASDRGLAPFCAHDVTGTRLVIFSRNTITNMLYRTRELYEAGLAFDRSVNEVTRDWKKAHPAPWGTDEDED